ncbi:MAG: hypothetical protein CMJ83_04055 [Planctomycetes bacterium]|nr:hypothetical protein [Planctomycetota bacterium]
MPAPHPTTSLNVASAPNVEGTRAITGIAMEAGAPLHHVSTVGVFDVVRSHAVRVDETTDLGDYLDVRGGYAQSKWVAERMVGPADRGPAIDASETASALAARGVTCPHVDANFLARLRMDG